jgi:hypothetical protein
MLPTRHLLEFLLTVYIPDPDPDPDPWPERPVRGESRRLGRSSRRLEAMTGAGGAMLIALGVGLAVTTRRGG